MLNRGENSNCRTSRLVTIVCDTVSPGKSACVVSAVIGGRTANVCPSSTVYRSSTPTGASFTGTTAIVTVAGAVTVVPSLSVYVNVSRPK